MSHQLRRFLDLKTHEEVNFRCLHCGTSNLKGKRNRKTGELEASGLKKHISLKRRNGRRECYEYYSELEHDYTTSLVHRAQVPAPDTPQVEESSQPGEAANNQTEMDNSPPNSPMEELSDPDESISSSASELDLGQFKDLVLPKSNSLPINAQFSRRKHRTSKANAKSLPTIAQIDTYTFPSRKLIPPISIVTILDHAQTKDLLEAKANLALAKLEAIAPTGAVTMQDEDDLAGVIIDDNNDVVYLSDNDDQNNHLDDISDTETEGEDSSIEVLEPTADAPPEERAATALNPNHLLDRLYQESQDRQDPNEPLPAKVKSHLQLLQLQERHKLSYAATEDIINWAKDSYLLDPNIFQDSYPSRNTMHSLYRGLLGLPPDAYVFKEKIVQWLPDNKPLPIHCRSFFDCLYEQLTKPSLLGPGSCNISFPHPTNPFCYDPQDLPLPPYVSELYHGSWYRKTAARLCTEPNDVLAPLALETDETFLDKFGRFTVTPFNLKVLIFNNATCRKEDASTTWFYLPNDEAEAAHHEQKTEAYHKIQNLHNAMRECFKDLKYLMDNKIGVPWKLTYGGKEHMVNLKFAIAFVISDTAMHDKLCCHFGVRNALIKCICRHCNCETRYLVNPDKFKKTKLWTPDQLDPDLVEEDQEYWKSVSHYPVKNALDELDHGSNTRKTHLNTCGEVLHMHQKGAMVRVVESLVYVWTKGKNVLIDDHSMSSKQKNIQSSLDDLNFIGHQYGAFLQRQSDREKPRTKFKNSLFATTKKCAHEQAGVLLCILLALLSDRGRQISIEDRTMTDAWVENQVYIIELILMMEVWLKKDKYPREHVLDAKRLSQAIAFYMKRLTVICPRDGMGNLLIKNHLMLHLPQYIMRWGPPSGWDTTPMERGHKTSSKRPAQLTQKHLGTFMGQVGKKFGELRIVLLFRAFFFIDMLFDKVVGKRKRRQGGNEVDSEEEEDLEADQQPPNLRYPKSTGSRFTLGIDSRGNAGVKWKTRPGRQTHLQPVIDFVADVVLPNVADGGEPVIYGFTEYKVILEEQDEPSTFRAHPSYKSASRQQRDVWYDWALFDMSKFGMGEKCIPGQILMFITVPYLKDEVTHQRVKLVPNQPHAVVRLFKHAPKRFRGRGPRSAPYSSIVSFGTTRDYLMIIPCRNIASTTIVVPNLEVLKPGSEKERWLGRLGKKPKRKKKRTEPNPDVVPLGEGYFVVDPRYEWGEGIGRLIESFKPTDGFE